ncbi:MAG: DUF2391 domain-containing protein [Myxococcales bacterium]|nr:DUF2391 domain-containing protein [Myxococcales bacterium]
MPAHPDHIDEERAESDDWQLPLIEVGWVLAGQLSPEDWSAIEYARERLRELFQALFPAFAWRMPLVHRREMIRQHRVTPVSLLEAGSLEREAAGWDFVLVVTEADLKGHYKPYLFGAPAQAFSVAVLSTSRLDPASLGVEATSTERTEVMTRRLIALAVHMFGHLNHVPHHAERRDFMYDLQSVGDLDAMETLSDGAASALHKTLARVADVRLEEMGEYARGGAALFVGSLVVREWREVLTSTLEIEPWQFPLKLSRLTTAAVSAMLILLNTAEAWDLGMSQTPLSVTLLSVVTLVGTSAFILQRQRLLARRSPRGLTELRVVSSVAIVLGMLIGMATTYAALFAGTLVIGSLLFSPELIQGWAPTIHQAPAVRHYFELAAFVASLGLIIGAMGASFEDEDYIRHVAFVDEET